MSLYCFCMSWEWGNDLPIILNYLFKVVHIMIRLRKQNVYLRSKGQPHLLAITKDSGALRSPLLQCKRLHEQMSSGPLCTALRKLDRSSAIHFVDWCAVWTLFTGPNIVQGEGVRDRPEDKGGKKRNKGKSIERHTELFYDSLVRAIFSAFSVLFLQGAFHPFRLV